MNPRFALFSLPLALALFSPLTAAFAATPEQKLAELGLTLPTPLNPRNTYVPTVRTGSLLFVSGHVSRDNSGKVIGGKVGRDITEADAAVAARQTALWLMATVKRELGELSKVKRIVRVSGFVNCVPDFQTQPTVINGCSDLLVAVFGERGRHARTALGAGSLPQGAAVEIEIIVEVE